VYKGAVKRMIRSRHQTLYRELGFDPPKDPNAVDYYTILDLEILGARRYGRDFVDWLLRNKNPLEILFRLAEEGGVVLLPGKGFGHLTRRRVPRWRTSTRRITPGSDA
jgi:aspartate 4-decarboxylase